MTPSSDKIDVAVIVPVFNESGAAETVLSALSDASARVGFELIIVDEPLAGLDEATYQRVHEYLHQWTQSGLSLIILSSKELPFELPKTNSYQIVKGGLV